MSSLLIRDAELASGRHADIRITAGTITKTASGLAVRPDDEVVDARGGALLPGLCDHHLHLHALAAHARSVQCGPPTVTDTATLADALAKARSDEHGWVRGVGYAADDLDATTLDSLHRERPVRVQHRSGALWTLNTEALTRLTGHHPGLERDTQGTPTGRLWRADDWLRAQLPPSPFPDLTQVGTSLSRLGITAVTDATPDLDTAAIDAITAAMRSGALPQHVQLLGAPLDWRPPDSGRAPSTGPVKIVLADSDLSDLDTLCRRITEAHAHHKSVAVHCVTREALVLLLTACSEVGARRGDRIEHAALVPPELLPTIAALGLRIVTQPGFLTDRGDDFLAGVPEAEHPDLYRCRSFQDAGIPLTLSSDAPHGPLDPWTVITAATNRRTRTGRTVGPAERLDVTEALAGYLTDPNGSPREIRPGATADLVLLTVPHATAMATPSADHVRMTIIAGTPVWTAP